MFVAKDLGKTITINKEAYVRRQDTAEYDGTRKASGFSLENCIEFKCQHSQHAYFSSGVIHEDREIYA